MTTPYHTCSSFYAATLPLHVQKRTFSETYIMQGSKATLKKVRVKMNVSRPIYASSALSFETPTFNFWFHYHSSSWTAGQAAPMQGVEAADAFTFHLHYYSSTGTASEAVPMEGIEYTSARKPASTQPSENGTARKVVVPKSRRRSVALSISEQAPVNAGDDEEEHKFTVRNPRSRAIISDDCDSQPVGVLGKKPAEDEPFDEDELEEVVAPGPRIITVAFDDD